VLGVRDERMAREAAGPFRVTGGDLGLALRRFLAGLRDNLDLCVQSMTRVPVRAVTLTGEDETP